MSKIYAGYTGAAEDASHVGQMNPLLAKLYHSHGIRNENTDELDFVARTDLCTDVARMIEGADRMVDREMATEILLALLKKAEKELKQAIAERFAKIDHAPLRLILQFVNDEIEIACPVLKYSKVLNDLDLLYIIQSRDSPFWQAIATREELGENVVEALVETNDLDTAAVLIKNEKAPLNEDVVRKVVRLIGNDDVLSSILIGRADLNKEMVHKIYQSVGAELKSTVEAKFGQSDAFAYTHAVDDVLSEMLEQSEPPFMPSAAMLKAADHFMEEGKLTKVLMVNTLKRGQLTAFIAQFSRFAHLPVPVVIAMLQQKDGHNLAIACKAHGIDRESFLIMFTSTRKMVGPNYKVSGEVLAALTYYDRVTPDVARRMVARTSH